MTGRRRIPGLDGKGESGLAEIFNGLEKRLTQAEKRPAVRETQTRDFVAREGETITVEAPARGLNATLVRASKVNKGARVTFIQLTAGPVTFRAVDGLVNGEPSVLSNAPGTFDAVSDGQTGWSLSQGITAEGVIGAPGTPGAVGPPGPPGPPGPTGSGGGGDPATGSENGYLSRVVYANASSSRVGTTFVGETVQAVPASWATDADIPDGNWFHIVVVAGGGGGGGGSVARSTDGNQRGGGGGGGGARHPPVILARAELVAALPIAFVIGLGGAGGAGATISANGTATGTAGSNGAASSVTGTGLTIFAGSGALGNVSTTRNGAGGGVFASGSGTTGGVPDDSLPFSTGRRLLNVGGGPGSDRISTGGSGTGYYNQNGGAGGGSAANSGGNVQFHGMRSRYGGCGGGHGGSAERAGFAHIAGYNPSEGGSHDIFTGTVGGGGGTAGSQPNGAGGAGADGSWTEAGQGGGGGGSYSNNAAPPGAGGAGGAGGFPGGGGGGGGAVNCSTAVTVTAGAGGDGGDGCIIIDAFA